MHHGARIGEGSGWVEPLDVEGLALGRTARDPDNDGQGEDAERYVLHVGQDPLDVLAQPDAPVVHQGHKDDEQHTGGRDHHLVFGQ